MQGEMQNGQMPCGTCPFVLEGEIMKNAVENVRISP